MLLSLIRLGRASGVETAHVRTLLTASAVVCTLVPTTSTGPMLAAGAQGLSQTATSTPLLEPLPIPSFQPARWVSRADGVVI